MLCAIMLNGADIEWQPGTLSAIEWRINWKEQRNYHWFGAISEQIKQFAVLLPMLLFTMPNHTVD